MVIVKRIFKKNIIHYKSIRGNFRKLNEDCTLHCMKNNLLIMVVCDGMGGHKHGKTASNIAAQQLINKFKTTNFNIKWGTNNYKTWLVENINYVKKYMKEYAKNCISDDYMDMGTTLLVCIYDQQHLYIANVGDSRLYLIDKINNLKLVTKDQNISNENFNISNFHTTFGKMLISALGPTKNLKIDTYCIKNFQGYLLMCTDGLYNFLNDYYIRKIICSKISNQNKVKRLIEQALANLSTDNITAMLLQVDPPSKSKLL